MPLTKVSAGVIAANAVQESVGSQSITGDKLGLTAINANNIVNATITGVKIAANTITGDDLGQNSVSANNIATNAIENYTALTNRPLSNRNIVINGAMTVVQRNANTTSITTTGYYSPDRFNIELGSASGTWTMNVDSVGVNRAGPNEFGNSCNLIVTTANTNLGTGGYVIFSQLVEGLNLQQVKKGTANAESLTVSFWAKSSNTGTFICELYDNDNSRQCSQSYTISTAGTWEKKVITFPADTTGRFDNDNALSLYLTFFLASGTTFTSGILNTTWASVTNANRAVGQLNLANRAGNYIAITGVQMETGTVATPFEMRSIGTELALCQRYYWQQGGGSYTRFGGGIAIGRSSTVAMTAPFFPVAMRAFPTVSSINLGSTSIGGTNASSTAVDPGEFSTNYFNGPLRLLVNLPSGLTAGTSYEWESNNNTSTRVAYSAEL
jgi:hypothetical protein